MTLRKKLLKVDELHMYDLFAPLVEEFDMKITYDEAKEIVTDALKPLGQDYLDVLKGSFNNGWIDIYENEGKRSGAYSWGAYGTHPYVLLNHKENLNSMFTLAHEMGHAMHSYLSDTNQEYRYAQYTIFLAEVASTLNEALLMDYLLKKTTNPKEKMYLLTYYADQFRTTVFRQTMFAEFEMLIHARAEAGESLTPQDFSKIYYDLNVKTTAQRWRWIRTSRWNGRGSPISTTASMCTNMPPASLRPPASPSRFWMKASLRWTAIWASCSPAAATSP
jgi:oligoendopeptidase F